MNPQQKIDSARYWALTTPTVAFYGAIACNLRDVLDESIKTASTDGRVIRWSPSFVERLTKEEVRFVLLHEVLHCAHGHFWRLPITAEGNVAGDYVINRTLRDVPGVRMPKGALDDRKFDRMAEEEVLATLRQQPQQPKPQPPQPGKPGEGDGNGPGEPGEGPSSPSDDEGKGKGTPRPDDAGGCGGFEAPAPDAQPEPAKAGTAAKAGVPKPTTLREEWERATVQAAQASQSLAQGNLPADVKRLLDRVRATAAPDWRAETADFLKSAISDRADWSRQARRTALAPVIYPRRRPDAVGTVVVVRDTSGSVDDKLVGLFNAHVRDMVADVNCDVVLLDADADVQAEHRLTPGDDVPDRAKGGGGTDFRPAFARVAELTADGERIAGVVYLTDLCGTFPTADQAGDVPVLWVATTTATAPIGRTVRIEA